MRKFITIGFTALTLSLGAPLAASAAAIPQTPGVTAALGSLSDGAGKSFSGSGAEQDFSNCRCRRYTRYRAYRYRYYVRYYYVVYW